MVQKVTSGIKVTVKSRFEGLVVKKYTTRFVFGYQIKIENQSKDAVQLQSRHWQIKDALNNIELVDGEGVVGQKPVLNPGEIHTYSSSCLLVSPLGAMKGFYNMINFSSAKKFSVQIPNFKLSAPFALN